jgi:hypothetical protein
MRPIPTALSLAFCLCASFAVAQVPAGSPEHFAVFHSPGEHWERRFDHRDKLIEHRRIYDELAKSGEIVVGGRFQGAPVLGLSVFRADADRVRLREVLMRDPSVQAGIIKIEFRTWELQLGALRPVAAGNESARK